MFDKNVVKITVKDMDINHPYWNLDKHGKKVTDKFDIQVTNHFGHPGETK